MTQPYIILGPNPQGIFPQQITFFFLNFLCTSCCLIEGQQEEEKAWKKSLVRHEKTTTQPYSEYMRIP